MQGRIVISVLAATLLVAAPVAAAEEPRRGGSLVVVLGADPEHLNPAISTGYPVGAVGATIFSALVWLDAERRPQPDLAESWEISPDGLTFTFHLRRDARWHDGQPLTSADVKFTMEKLLGPYHGRFRRAYDHIEAIETPDDHTVVIRLRKPFAPLMGLLSVFDAPILPKHIFDGTDPFRNPATLRPVGSGPFIFREWVRGDRIVVERNPDYYEEPAYLDRVIFRIIPTEVARVIALETGEADVVLSFYLPWSEVPRLERHPDLKVWKGVTIPALYFIFVNTKHPQLSDPRVRQALMHAIDRDQIVEQAMMGLGRPAGGPFGVGFPWAYGEATDYQLLYPYDPSRAQALLGEAGVDRLTLNYVFDAAREPFRIVGEIIKDNLRAVGIDLKLVPMERSVMIEHVYHRRAFDLTMQSFTSTGDPAIGYHRLYVTTEPGVAFTNASGYSNPEVDAILTRAGMVIDLDERGRLYRQAAEILARDLPVLVLFDELMVEVYHRRVRGLRQGLDSRDRMHRVWLAQ